MVRAGEKITYCSVGHWVCHIYFASSIETLEKQRDKCERKLSERGESCLGILTIKEKNRYLNMCTIHLSIKSANTYFTLEYVLLHNNSNSVFRDSSITCVTYKLWQLLALQSLVPC